MSNGRALPALRNIVMFGAPTLLGLLELGHPAFWMSDPVIDTVAPIAPWWTALHVAQVPLFALRGVAVVLLLRDVQGHAALISRCAIAVFIVVYPAFDAAVGIASGVMLQNLSALDAAGRAAVEPALWALFWGPVTGTMAIIGAVPWLVALAAAALAWRQAGGTVLECGLLLLSATLTCDRPCPAVRAARLLLFCRGRRAYRAPPPDARARLPIARIRR